MSESQNTTQKVFQNPHQKALLIYPEFPENSFWNLKYLHSVLLPKNRFGMPRSDQPPLNLLCVAKVLAEKYGRQNVRLIDMNVQPLTEEDLLWCDDLYLSGMLTQKESFDKVAQWAQSLHKTTIAGGPYVSEDSPHLDHIFINECEYTIRPFLDDLFQNKAAKIIVGEKPQATDFLTPDYSYIEWENYGTMPVQFSRGCPFACEFCDITVRYGRAMRTRSNEEFFKDLNGMYEGGWRGQVFVLDDNFIGKPKEALLLLQELKQWQTERNFPFEFYTQASVTLAESQFENLLKAFAPAGFSMIFLGIETPNTASLKETNKIANLRPGHTLVEKIKRIQKVGQMMILGGFIIGFDNDDAHIFDEQINFIKDLQIPTPMIGLLHPLPHTELARKLQQENRLVGNSKGAVAGSLELTFTPKLMSAKEMVDGYKSVLREVYLNMGGFYDRCFSSIKYIARPKFGIDFKRHDLIAVKNLLIKEGILSKHRFVFWKYLFKVLFFHPQKVAYGIRWAAYGMHFSHLTQRLLEES